METSNLLNSSLPFVCSSSTRKDIYPPPPTPFQLRGLPSSLLFLKKGGGRHTVGRVSRGGGMLVFQISFEPGFAEYQSLAQKIKVSSFKFFSFFLEFLRVRGRFQNPRQTAVRTKLRLKRFPSFVVGRKSDQDSVWGSLALRSFMVKS